MGYETKIYISRVEDDGYCSQIAMVDLSKCGQGKFATLVKESTPATPEYFLLFGDDDKVDKDMYDSPLSCMSATDALFALRQDNERDPYRRFNIAIAMIEQAIDGFSEESIKIIGYGH